VVVADAEASGTVVLRLTQGDMVVALLPEAAGFRSDVVDGAAGNDRDRARRRSELLADVERLRRRSHRARRRSSERPGNCARREHGSGEESDGKQAFHEGSSQGTI